ncbi:hypothetical protein [Ferrimonas sp.]|uniref:hypothetical protein n=1 Tax=Ferrimonas sp. TaxID=2080861 RepID=UPI003A93005F
MKLVGKWIFPLVVWLACSAQVLSANELLSNEGERDSLVVQLQQSLPTLNVANKESEIVDLALSKKCCKICKKGKACGDSCIKKSYTCTKPKGCACNG